MLSLPAIVFRPEARSQPLSEVATLRWSDIDLDAATLSIANTRTMMGNRTVAEKDTKSMAGSV
ncbi:hypothetical protein [Streptomyces sp. M92]|uniref:hypothetical protein n=1 Tax=Streptomyces sp. M92 TaxID=2944250 RepID=UPI002349255A|nr:hypothetical protein [Streptomyces sp. M92]WCN04059.1 hypothetical protein M6G08_19155 [Streptomyces sp. M92]